MGEVMKTTDCILFTNAHDVKTALTGLQRRPNVTSINSYASLHTKRYHSVVNCAPTWASLIIPVNSVRNKDIYNVLGIHFTDQLTDFRATLYSSAKSSNSIQNSYCNKVPCYAVCNKRLCIILTKHANTNCYADSERGSDLLDSLLNVNRTSWIIHHHVQTTNTVCSYTTLGSPLKSEHLPSNNTLT
jgi:hypothetical protein